MNTPLLITLVLLGCLLGATVLVFSIGALHEGGHALAALLLQSGPVTVHLGTYMRPTGNWQFRLGRLHIYLARSILWRGGCCQAPAMAQVRWQEALFILAGPLLPLLLTGLVAWLPGGQKPSFGADGYVLWLVGHTAARAALVIAGLGAAYNLLPLRKRILLADGRSVPNDGRQLLNVWRRPRLTAALNAQLAQAEAHRQAGEYAASAALYAQVLARAMPTPALLRPGIFVLLQASRYAEALTLSTKYHQLFAAGQTDGDRFTHALLLSRTGQHELALAACTALIEQPQPYPIAYVNRGYTYNLLGQYALALADFDQSLTLAVEPSYVHANRGLALLKLDQTAAGLAAIAHSLALDPANAYAHRNLGIYHLDRGEYAAALALFEQAGQLDPTTHGLAEYTQKARQHPEETSGTGGLTH